MENPNNGGSKSHDICLTLIIYMEPLESLMKLGDFKVWCYKLVLVISQIKQKSLFHGNECKD